MNTRTSVQAAIDQRGKIAFTGIAPILFGNQLDTALSAGEVSYLRQRVIFPITGQRELGNTASSRTHGNVVFTLYVKRGKGDGDRNTLAQVALDTFQNKQFGGATFFGSRELPGKDTENWCLTGIQIPFYFDEV